MSAGATMRGGRWAARRLCAVAAGLVGAAALLAPLPAAAFSETYTFAGLEWGSSPDKVTEVLESQGFAVEGPVLGPRREFVERNAWGIFESRDRGMRLVAKGLVAGHRFEVDLVFGFNERLERVILRAPDWDGSLEGAKRLTGLADTLARQFERQYGRSYDSRKPFGFTDTARWMQARDGSRIDLYVRGTNGYMFFPQDVTSLRVHFWNDRFRAAPPSTMTAGSGEPPGHQAKTDGIRPAAAR